MPFVCGVVSFTFSLLDLIVWVFSANDVWKPYLPYPACVTDNYNNHCTSHFPVPGAFVAARMHVDFLVVDFSFSI